MGASDRQSGVSTYLGESAVEEEAEEAGLFAVGKDAHGGFVVVVAAFSGRHDERYWKVWWCLEVD